MKYLWIPALLAACGGDDTTDTPTDTTADTTTPTAPESTTTGRWIGTCLYDPPDLVTSKAYTFDFDSVFTLIESDDGSIAGTWTFTLVPTTSTGTFGTLVAGVVGERADDQVSLATTELYGYGSGYTTTTGDLPSFEFDLVLANDALAGGMIFSYGTEPFALYTCDLAREG